MMLDLQEIMNKNTKTFSLVLKMEIKVKILRFLKNRI